MNLSPEFIQTILNTFEDKGQHWLDSFPALFDEASHRWGLTDIQPVPNLSYNFVAFAHRLPSPWGNPTGVLTCTAPHCVRRKCREGGGGEGEVVLKLGVPNRELTSEIAALRLYNGHGVVRLLDADPEKGMLLLERLQPGHMLATLEDDVRATEIAADVMIQLWSPIPKNTKNFIQLKDWFDGFKRLRQRFDGETGPLPKRLVKTAESLSKELLVENKDETLLHGDFHHFNVLESERGWLAIDPKGVIGPRGYELGPFLINPNDRFLSGSNPTVQTEMRIAILSEKLGMERERIRSWGLCHAVLSAWWCIEGNDPGCREYSLRCAEIFMQVHV